MRWKLSDLVTDDKTGRLRETKLWSNIGKAAMTFAFVVVTWRGAGTEWLWLTYGGVVVLHELGSKALNQKQQQMDKEKPE
jgi:hypothetical protein